MCYDHSMEAAEMANQMNQKMTYMYQTGFTWKGRKISSISYHNAFKVNSKLNWS